MSEPAQVTGTRRRPPTNRATVVERASAACSCSATCLPTPAGPVILVRVAGEVDIATHHLLRTAITAGLARQPSHLLVDLATVTFCDVGGMALLVETGATAAGHGIGYAVSGAPRQVENVWALLWPGHELPARFSAVPDHDYPRAGEGTVQVWQ